MAPTEFPAGVWINPTLEKAITKAPWARENPGGDVERTNAHRRRDARLVLTAYRKLTMTDPAADPESESVPDLLTDLMHLAAEMDIAADGLFDRAFRHFDAERATYQIVRKADRRIVWPVGNVTVGDPRRAAAEAMIATFGNPYDYEIVELAGTG